MHILPKKIRSVISEHRLQKEKEQDFLAAAQIDVTNVRTLCLALGPYRNLTTLTASVLFLHPNCQVLNHGSARIFEDPRMDFLQEYSEERFENFLKYVIHISTGGGRGKSGGSIIHSHAFDEKHPLGKLYKARFGRQVLKKKITSVFWKESLRTSQHLRNNSVDLDTLFQKNQKLRFLLPVRHPIDCALSNQKTGHAKQFGLEKDAPLEVILEAILSEVLWVIELKQQFPDKVFYFLENAFDAETVDELASFLQLPADKEWKQSTLEAFNVGKHYQHGTEMKQQFKSIVEEKFSAYPEFKQQLLAFLHST